MYGEDKAEGYEGEDRVADMPLGQDVHQTINEIAEIDAKILRLRKEKEIRVARINKAMDEVQKHFNDVVNVPTEAPGVIDRSW